MAIDYTKLFGEIGKLVKTVNETRKPAVSAGGGVPDLPTLKDDVRSTFNTNSDFDQLAAIDAVRFYDGLRDSAIDLARSVADLVTIRLMDRDTVIEQLSGLMTTPSIQDVLRELIRDMKQTPQNVKKSTVTLGSVSSEGTPKGNGTIKLFKTLDGVTPPDTGMIPVLEYFDVDSELAFASEKFTATCIRDSTTDGLPEGEEEFLWEGRPQAVSGGPFSWRDHGTGTRRIIRTATQEIVLTNQGFEFWDGANTPTSWTIVNGAAGTNVIEESAASNVQLGDKSLKLVSTGATITLRQPFNRVALSALKRYFNAVWYKEAGTNAVAAGTLEIKAVSPSGETVSTDSILRSVTNTATTFTLLNSDIEYDSNEIPSDIELQIQWTGSTSGDIIWLDGLMFYPLNWARHGMAIVPASSAFMRGDRLVYTVTNDLAGVFQTFFMRQFGVQLPSSATPTIADTLAT